MVTGSLRAMTVLGPITTSELGVTLVHEHLYMDARPLLGLHPYSSASDELVTIENAAEARWNPGAFSDNYVQNDVDLVIKELSYFKRAGGSCVVDVTPSHLGRHPRILREIALKTGLHVIMGGGYYLDGTHPPELKSQSVEALAEGLSVEFWEGVDDTGIRPGIIGEIGTSDPLAASEERVLRACAVAQRNTGLSISIHLHPWGLEGGAILSVFEQEGSDLSRIVLGHMTTATGNDVYQLDLLRRGVNLAYDLFGFDHSLLGCGRYPPSDLDVVKQITRLADAGFLSQLLISHDIGGVKTRLRRYGGWGYAHILEHVLPLFRDAGWREEDLGRLLVDNPARLLNLI